MARTITERLHFDFIDRDIIKEVAESAKISASVIETLEKKVIGC